ncbi:MAG TPA: hypothetical protein VJS90_05600 [Pseudomonas sp.]|uniref:hypothetical protein n=1 Tax=Pseudomonas sp. TaxID=306 RepID=UPI002B4796C5|nr:hypothetical protein [Pseudomonas sp.]HKS12496.1 hypothetical protein [Pseudomonas sp.]
MSRRASLWVALVFGLTVLLELPATWLARALALPAQGVTGSLWQGQARQVAEAGPLRWHWRPWRLHAQAWFGYQGQEWEVQVRGWPWDWHAQLQALGTQRSADSAYRLAGQWKGAIHLQGAGQQCRGAQGRIAVDDLALVAPWSLGLGQGWLQVDCSKGWHLAGQLALTGQHQASLDADLLARQARLKVELQPDAALLPVLRGSQWLDAGATQLQRRISW